MVKSRPTLTSNRPTILLPEGQIFISDIMAMANAETRDDRHIIFGVKLQPDGTKTHPIATYPDPAEIEQLILQNIEPIVQC